MQPSLRNIGRRHAWHVRVRKVEEVGGGVVEEAARAAGGVAQVLWREHQEARVFAAALAHEWSIGRATIDSGETREGATRFAKGAGRHGRDE